MRMLPSWPNYHAQGEEAGIRFIQNNTTQLACDILTRRKGANAGLDLIIRQSNSSGAITTTFVITPSVVIAIIDNGVKMMVVLGI